MHVKDIFYLMTEGDMKEIISMIKWVINSSEEILIKNFSSMETIPYIIVMTVKEFKPDFYETYRLLLTKPLSENKDDFTRKNT